MDWREDIGRKSQYQRIPDDEAAGLKNLGQYCIIGQERFAQSAAALIVRCCRKDMKAFRFRCGGLFRARNCENECHFRANG